MYRWILSCSSAIWFPIWALYFNLTCLSISVLQWRTSSHYVIHSLYQQNHNCFYILSTRKRYTYNTSSDMGCNMNSNWLSMQYLSCMHALMYVCMLICMQECMYVCISAHVSVLIYSNSMTSRAPLSEIHVWLTDVCIPENKNCMWSAAFAHICWKHVNEVADSCKHYCNYNYDNFL